MAFAAEREALVRAGRELLKKGLVARTWGNLSIRVDGGRFLITPSGRSYEMVGPDDLALVTLDDLTWEGPLKPSSEKELHARTYRMRPDVGAVIHTHQSAASSLAAARKGFAPQAAAVGDTGIGRVPGADEADLGSVVPCVPYALPTTRALARAVEKTLETAVPGVKALLLSNHGAVCLGADIDGALRTALMLEEAAEAEILTGFRARIGDEVDNGAAAAAVRAGVLSEYAGNGAGGEAWDVSAVEELLTAVRKALPRAAVRAATTPYVVAAAGRGRTVVPYLDDFAQIIGPSLPVVTVGQGGAKDVRRIVRALGRRSAVLVPGLGCVCAAGRESDAQAVAMVAEKGCRAAVETGILGGGRRIARLEARFMRLIYLAKYSKKAL